MVGMIFDFNGTLFLDSEKQEASWAHFVKAEWGRTISETEFREIIHGRNSRDTMEYFSGKLLTDAQVDVLTEKKESIYRKLCLEDPVNFHLTPGAESLLDELCARSIPRAIATASGKNNVGFFWTHFHLGRWFEPSNIIYDDGTIEGKPAPDFYLRAAAALSLPPTACIVVEDASSGIQAAHRAGIGKIIAIAPRDQQERFLQIPEIFDVIPNFHAFDRFLLREA